jgi:hypothetical protein
MGSALGLTRGRILKLGKPWVNWTTSGLAGPQPEAGQALVQDAGAEALQTSQHNFGRQYETNGMRHAGVPRGGQDICGVVGNDYAIKFVFRQDVRMRIISTSPSSMNVSR